MLLWNFPMYLWPHTRKNLIFCGALKAARREQATLYQSKIIILISCSWARPSIHVCSLVHVTYVSRTYALPNINTTIIATEPFCAVAVNFLVKKPWWAQHSCVSVGKEKMLLWNFPMYLWPHTRKNVIFCGGVESRPMWGGCFRWLGYIHLVSFSLVK